MVIQDKIKNLILESLKNLGIDGAQFVIEHPTDLSMGDYSTNVAMLIHSSLAKSIQENKPSKVLELFRGNSDPNHRSFNPREIGETIVAELNKNKIAEIEKIEVAGPGFINFYLSPAYFHNELKNILSQGENWGRVDTHKGKKILIEHSSPNLFKPFHIGHVMNNAIGESITRFARFSGAEVVEISYPSDVSFGIGKAVWALLEGGLEKLNKFETEGEKLNYLGECYVRGTRALEEDKSLEPRMREITKLIYDKTASPEYDAYNIGREINLTYFKNMASRLGSTFDDFIFESEAGKEGEKLVRANIGSIFKESDGAVIYEGEQDGLHTRVFINKEGYPTYEAKDVGLLSLKFARYNPDVSIFITDHEQSEYFKVVVHAAGKINIIWQDKTIHRTHGRMSFKGQKMSSRLGGVPIASDLLSAVAEEVREKSKEISQDKVEMIAIAALKFAILKSMAGKNINFDPETSLSFEGDSGPYLQYSAVRSNSILEKVPDASYEFAPKENISDIEKYLVRFPEVVEKCISLWEPHHLVAYLLELSQAFNSWYGQVRVIDEANPEMQYNLAIVKVFNTTVKNGLYLLGIETPEKM